MRHLTVKKAYTDAKKSLDCSAEGLRGIWGIGLNSLAKNLDQDFEGAGLISNRQMFFDRPSGAS